MEGEKYNLDGEINNFIKVYLSVFASLYFCYVTSKVVPKGLPRLLTFIPVVYLFFALPLTLRSMNLGGTTAFFIVWLANFKLLSLAFHKGPLSDPSLSLPQFIAIGCFPIKIQENPPSKDQNKQNPSPKIAKKGHKSLSNYAIKVVLMALFVRIYKYSEHIHPWLILVLYCFHMYFMLELMLVGIATVARATLGLELEPQFNDPYLSTSLQDFWGRRWNLMVTRILRPTVYDPILDLSIKVVGRKWAPLPAVLSTFMVSALMHEIIFYYMGRTWPTWEITWFFLLHGVCLAIEIGIKKALPGRCRLPPVISTPLTIGFVVVTGFWLFFPALLRCKGDVRAFEEYAMVGAFLKDFAGGADRLRHFNATEV